MENKEKVESQAAEPEVVKVDKTQLDKILNEIEALKKDNIKLNSIADKSRLARFDEQNGTKSNAPRYKLSTFGGQVILAWKMIKDVVEKNVSSGLYYEHQEYEYILEDGSKGTIVGYNKFANIQYGNQIEVEEVSRNVSPEATMLKVRDVKTNKQYEIDIRFVN